jgi:membrane protease YdiL (CAAX protease family)
MGEDGHVQPSRRRALVALALLVPAPTLGALTAFVLAPGPLGQAVYAAGKLWILALPLAWLLLVERKRISLSPLPAASRARALIEGTLLGVAFGAVVLGAYALVGERWLAPARLREMADAAGFGTPGAYLAIAAYLALVNSLLEEYVWRWFVYRQAERLMRPALAVPLSALLFTLHHILVFAVQLGPQIAVLGSIGVFVGGCIWSALYARWRSVWPAWVSHVLVDVAGLWIGWRVLF